MHLGPPAGPPPVPRPPSPECRAQAGSSSGLCTPGLKLLCVLDKAQLTPGTHSHCGGSRLTSACTSLRMRPGHPDGRHMGRQLARGTVPLPLPYVGGSLQPSFPMSVAGQPGIYSTDGGRPGLAHPPARGGLPSHGTRGIPAQSGLPTPRADSAGPPPGMGEGRRRATRG